MTPWFGAWATGRVGLSFTEKVKIKGGPHRVLLCFLFTYCNCGLFFPLLVFVLNAVAEPLT